VIMVLLVLSVEVRAAVVLPGDGQGARPDCKIDIGSQASSDKIEEGEINNCFVE